MCASRFRQEAAGLPSRSSSGGLDASQQDKDEELDEEYQIALALSQSASDANKQQVGSSLHLCIHDHAASSLCAVTPEAASCSWPFPQKASYRMARPVPMRQPKQPCRGSQGIGIACCISPIQLCLHQAQREYEPLDSARCRLQQTYMPSSMASAATQPVLAW